MPFVKVIYLISIVNFNVYAVNQQTITLSIGQVTEISLKGQKSFNISNKEVLSTKTLSAQRKLFIKGAMKGQSIVTVWSNSGQKTVYSVYVLSKSGQFQVLETMAKLKNYGILGRMKGDKLIISDDIKTIDQYLLIKPLINNDVNIIFKGELKDSVAKEIFAEVHHRFFQNFYDDIRCEKERLDITCETGQEILADKKFISAIEKKYLVKFRLSQRFNNILNHKLELRIIQIERLDGKEINFGLDQIDVGLADLLAEGADALAKSQSITFRESDYNVSTLATQRILLRTNENSRVQIGSEVPYTTTTVNNGNNTQWKFAGLKIAMKLTKINNRYKLKYQTRLTRPMNQVNGDTYISGSVQESSFLINKNTPIQMFEVDLTTDDNTGRKLPILGDIPILGKLFSSSTSFKTYKRIIAIANLK